MGHLIIVLFSATTSLAKRNCILITSLRQVLALFLKVSRNIPTGKKITFLISPAPKPIGIH